MGLRMKNWMRLTEELNFKGGRFTKKPIPREELPEKGGSLDIL